MAGSKKGAKRTAALPTRDRILKAFLELATRRGIDSTSTRAVADAAGVSELTLFRQFGDKATLTREAIRRGGAPTHELAAIDLEIDASTKAAAAESLARCLKLLRDRALENRGLMQFTLTEAYRHPELARDLVAAPLRAQAVLRRTIEAIGPQLPPDVDPEVALVALQGTLMMTVLWTTAGWLRLTRADWDRLLESAANLVVRSEKAKARRPRRS
jgi:AcrR family transcriptional regulator